MHAFAARGLTGDAKRRVCNRDMTRPDWSAINGSGPTRPSPRVASHSEGPVGSLNAGREKIKTKQQKAGLDEPEAGEVLQPAAMRRGLNRPLLGLFVSRWIFSNPAFHEARH
jgi:hypothetical protein